MLMVYALHSGTLLSWGCNTTTLILKRMAQMKNLINVMAYNGKYMIFKWRYLQDPWISATSS